MATSTQSKAPASVANIAVGRYINGVTAAAFVITTGFKPRFVRVMNNTSFDELVWSEGMADASGFKRLAAGTGTAIASLGITPTATGFTVGLDTDINVISEQLSWIAIG